MIIDASTTTLFLCMKNPSKLLCQRLSNNRPSIDDKYDSLALSRFSGNYPIERQVRWSYYTCEKSLKIGLSRLGDSHLNISNAYSNMALVYNQGKYDFYKFSS